MEYYLCNILDWKLTLKYWEKLTDHQSQKSLTFQKDALFFVFNDTLMEELVLYWIQYKNSLKYKVGCFWRFSYIYIINYGLRVPLKNENFNNNFLLIHGIAVRL